MTFLAIAFLVNRWFFQGARGLTGVASRLLNHATDFYGATLRDLGLIAVHKVALTREDVVKGFPAARALLEGLPFVLQHELSDILEDARDSDKPLSAYGAIPKRDLDTWDKWTNILLDSTGFTALRYEHLSEVAPVLTLLLDNFREDGNSFYSVLLTLRPGHNLPRHVDISPLLRRLHVPLLVDPSGPVRVQIGDEWLTTKTLEPFFFDQTVPHAVDNQMESGKRVNLVLDLIAPTKLNWLNELHGLVFKSVMALLRRTNVQLPPIVETDPLIAKLEEPMGGLFGQPWQLAQFALMELWYHNTRVQAILDAYSKHERLAGKLEKQSEGMAQRLVGHMVTLHHSVQANLYVPTMLNGSSLRAIETWIKHLVHKGVPGGFLEAGVWRGGGTILMKHLSNQLTNGTRPVYVLDSFEGMENIDGSQESDDLEMDQDCSLMLNEARRVLGSQGELIETSLAEVQQNFEVFLGPDYHHNVKFLKGWFDDENFAWGEVEELAMLRLDVDYYKPIKIALEKLYDKVSVGGVIILDEYNLKFMGEHLAVDEFRASRRIQSPMISVGPHGAFWIKQEE